jgi:hypothetical protein
VSDPVRVGSEEGDGLDHEGVFPEQTARFFYHLFLLFVEEGISHFCGNSPGYLLCMTVFRAQVHAGMPHGFIEYFILP